MIYTGKLNRRLTFQRLEAKEDEMGQDKSSWQDYKTVWGSVKPYKSSEYNFMGKLKPEVSHRIYVRFRNDITADMRIKYHGRIFTIEGTPLDIDERHELLEIQCREVFEGNEYQV